MKKLFAAFLVAALALPAAADLTYTNPTTGVIERAAVYDGRLQVDIAKSTERFTCSVVGQAAALAQCAAISAGKSYYITDIVAQSSTTTAGDFAIQSGTGSNCGTGTTAVMPAPPATTGARYKAPPNSATPMFVSLTTPIKVTQGHAVCVIGMATNTLNITISGYLSAK